MAGRPTDYNPKYIKEVSAYLQECQDEENEFHKTRGEKSDGYERLLKVRLPTIEDFARRIKVNKTTLYEWEKKYKAFSNALDDIRAEQKQRLIEKGLSGDYNPVIAKLVLAANHGMADKTESDITSNGQSITFAIAETVAKKNAINTKAE